MSEHVETDVAVLKAEFANFRNQVVQRDQMEKSYAVLREEQIRQSGLIDNLTRSIQELATNTNRSLTGLTEQMTKNAQAQENIYKEHHSMLLQVKDAEIAKANLEKTQAEKKFWWTVIKENVPTFITIAMGLIALGAAFSTYILYAARGAK
jgi:hypothetical protein